MQKARPGFPARSADSAASGARIVTSGRRGRGRL